MFLKNNIEVTDAADRQSWVWHVHSPRPTSTPLPQPQLPTSFLLSSALQENADQLGRRNTQKTLRTHGLYVKAATHVVGSLAGSEGAD